ncbi:circularly permutated Ras protein 1-like [Pecten maximus]|uniref:circularly permutated Ras protein 1-like n=1 Tax=Pecten maximus TaxID=6579 RepID=UPI0014583619|nr:circularly permutated Ras protein 1-like [Pecten maximus]
MICNLDSSPSRMTLGSKPEQKREALTSCLKCPPLPDPPGHVAPKESKKCEKATSNVVLVSLKTLDDPQATATGDPVKCDCHAVLSSISNTVQDDENLKWNCEFCQKENIIPNTKKEEVPTESVIDYIMSPPAPSDTKVGQQAGTAGEQEKLQMGKGYTIYCIDISRSMSSAAELPELQG